MRHKITVLGVFAAAAMLAGLTVPHRVVAQASDPQLSARIAGSQVFTDFELNPSNTDDLAHRLRSGLPVSVLWVLEPRLDVRAWRDVSGLRATIRVAVRPGADRQSFALTESINGVLQRAFTRGDLAGAITDLTSFRSVPTFPCDALPFGHTYTIAVRAILDGGGSPRVETAVLATTSLEGNGRRPNIGLQSTADGEAGGRCG